MTIPFLSSTLAKMKDILTWDPRRVRNWGSRYFSEPRKNEKIKSLNHSYWGSFPDKATELSEVSIMVDSQALERGTKTVQLLSRVSSAQTRASKGQFPNTQPRPQRRLHQQHFHPNTLLAISLSFRPASSFLLPQPTTPPLTISLWLARFLSTWDSLEYGGLWPKAFWGTRCLYHSQELGSAEMKVINPQGFNKEYIY